MDPQPLYLRLANHYRRAIQTGVLAPAQRMPSVRTLVRTHHVSLSTALQACRQLEDDGLIEARPRSGYFVLKPRRNTIPPVDEPDIRQALGAAQYVGIHDRVSDFVAKCEAHPVSANFALAAAVPEAYPLEELKQAMIRALRQSPQVLVSPVPPQGHPDLRTVLARRALANGINATPDDVIVTHGCIEALNLALRAVARPGDTIAVESPAYFGLLQILESLGMRALEIPTSPQHGLSIEALDLAFQTHGNIRAVVVVPNFQNPLGCVMPDAEKARLVALCERQQVPLIEDDTYGALTDDDTPLAAAKSWDATGNVIYCSSMHKTLAPGMRLGWLLGGRWKARIAMLKFAQSRPNEPLAQIAVAEFMGSRAYDRHLSRLRRHLKMQRDQTAETIAAHFPSGTRLSVPQGGMLLWVEMPDGRSGMDVFEAALRQGIRVAPGAMFSNGTRYNHFLRISCGQRTTPEITAALQTLARIVGRAAQMNPALHQFIVDYGLWAVLAGTLLEGESVVVFAGFLAHQHLLHLPYVVLCAFAGSFLADQALFLLGRRYRDHRYVRRIREKPAFEKALAAVDRYPHGFILSLRFLYGLRTVGPVALGVSNVPPLRFLVLNAIAAAIWAVCFSTLGYLFGQTIESMLGRLHGVETKLAVAIAIGVLIWLAYHLLGRRRK